ncbi:TAXI family TRAP transporter solute-binding subunit [Thermodesulfobacteriota bacterium]
MKKLLKKSIISVMVLAFMFSFVLLLTSEASAKQKTLPMTWLASPVGSDGYNFGSALSDIIKKNSYIRMSAVETMGDVDMLKAMSDMSSEKRKVHMGACVGALLNLARIGKGPFGKSGKIKGWRILFTMYNVLPHFMTLDPKMKSGKDLIGKRIGFPPRQHGMAKDAAYILKVWGIDDKVKKVHMPMDLQKDALLDGTVDVIAAGGMYLNEGEVKTSPNNEVILQSRKNVYFIGVDKADGEMAKAKYPSTLVWVPVKAGARRPGYPAKDWGVFIQSNTAFAWAEMPADRAYDIVKVCAENAGKVKDYFVAGKAFSKGGMVQSCWGPENYHPGALKYFKEVGLKPSGQFK